MKRIRLFLLVFLTPVFIFAQEVNISGDLNNKLPVDQNIRIGVLDNGLKYYIRKNVKPEKRVEMRLVVNVGSIMEDEDQLGLAHFVEHMAFNGTKNFEKNEIVNYLQSIGVQFGADLNAYTSFDETVYILPIPTDDEEILNKGLQVLEDWAHNVTFTEEEIDKERGVVIEEWRLGQGANQRMQEKYFPILFKDSRYAERLPIGTKDIIENASYETIKKFYKDWYRPDLMAVIAVGDIDVDEMEGKIRSHFEPLENPADERTREFYPVPDHDQTFVAIASDKEAPYTMIRLFHKLEVEPDVTLGDYRRHGVYQLYNGMLNARLNELTQSSDPPFIFGSTSFGSLGVRTKNSYTSFAVVGEDGIEKGLKALLAENERVKKYGFTQAEMDRYKKDMLNLYDQAYKERDKSESNGYAREYIRNYTTNEPIPGIEFEYEYTKSYLPAVKLEEVNSLAQNWVKNTDRVVVITSPEKEGITLPTEEDIHLILDDASKMEISPYVEEAIASELMAVMPEAGFVASSKVFEKTDVTELTLSNGIKVVIKPTDFKNDEILMSASSPGGNSLYNLEDYYSASNAASIINQSGVRDFSPTDLQKLFAGKSLSVSPYIGTLSEGMRGNAAPKDFETMLQLINLYFTAPKKDSSAFQSLMTRNKMLYQNLMSNPQFYYSDQVSKIMNQNNPRGGGFPTPEDLEKVDFERAYNIYKERFSDASDFQFFLVGNLNIEEITPLLELYLGSLPNLKRNETWVDLNIRPPKGVVDEVVNKGTDPKSIVTINFTGEKPFDKKTNYNLRTLGEILTIKLTEIIREERSGAYTVGAYGASSKYPYESYSFRISFPCAPENVEELVSAALSEIEKIKENGVSVEDLQKVQETQRRDREESLKQNRFWLGQISGYYYNVTSLDTFFEAEELTEGVSSGEIQEAANKYINMENYVKVVLMPEE